MQAADQTKKTISLKVKLFGIFITLLLVVSLGANVFLIGKNINSAQKNVTVDEEISLSIKQEQSEPKSFAKEFDFLFKEYQLLTKSNKYAESKLFGFKFNQFHPDWQCTQDNLVFTDEGVMVTCRQKPCVTSAQNEDDVSLPVQKMSNECFELMENREYPNSVLPSFEIIVTPVFLEAGEILTDVVAFVPNKTTPKGIDYQINQNSVVFFSPKQLPDNFSQYAGTYFGSERVLAKYQINFEVYEAVDELNDISEDQLNKLVSNMIDTITFLD